MPYFYGLNVGQNESTPPVQGGSTTSRNVEIVINTEAAVPSVQDLINTLQHLENWILKNGKAW